jgi:hypothetical protein
MLYIEKKQEPNELIQEKRKGLTDYRNLSGKPKEAVQVSLLEEQGIYAGVVQVRTVRCQRKNLCLLR